MKKIDKLIEKLTTLNKGKDFSRLGTTFTTKNSNYLYDTGTGKVFMCDTVEYNILNSILNKPFDRINFEFPEFSEKEINKAVKVIQKLIDSEHILSMPRYTSFYEESHVELKEDDVIQHLILEVSEECNLRCKYCIFNETNDEFRNFSTKKMDWDVAKNALDYVISRAKDQLILGFYGGEPLLNFDVIYKSIEYVKKQAPQLDLIVTCTSNCVLITEDIAEYLSKVDSLKFVCSLDGDEEQHNAYRVARGGVGSYDKTLTGLKRLVDACTKNNSTLDLTIHSVVCPPINKEKLDRMYNNFKSLDWLPKNTAYTYAYVDDKGMHKSEDSLDRNIDIYAKGMEVSDPIKFWAKDRLRLIYSLNTYEFEIQKRSLVEIHERLLLEKPRTVANRNGCCVPGGDRLYVTVEGDFKACEKIGNSPSIGNVKEGIDYNQIEKYYFEQYDKATMNKCDSCWTIHLCPVCFAFCMDEDGVNMKEKNEICISARGEIKNKLIMYYELLEENPNLVRTMHNKFTNR